MTARADWTAYAPLDAGPAEQLRAAFTDLREGFGRHRAWRYLAAEHVKNSYRRTVIGPWWLTAQSALYVVGLAAVFGQLSHVPLKSFLPYVAVGFLSFALLSGLTRAGASIFISQAGAIKSTRQPLSGFVLRSVTIELIQFGHNIVILVMLLAAGFITITPWLAFAPLALFVMLANGLAGGLWLGPAVARFRDIGPLIDSVLQVIVFFTPVFYRASDLHGSRSLLVAWNPFTYLIDFFRSPVLGHAPGLGTVVGTTVFTLANLVLAVVVFSRTRSRLPYWVS
ncbi:MAG: transporter permease [Frankiales bacterium]|nr:transporter permease [Frankiales bacterium]